MQTLRPSEYKIRMSKPPQARHLIDGARELKDIAGSGSVVGGGVRRGCEMERGGGVRCSGGIDARSVDEGEDI